MLSALGFHEVLFWILREPRTAVWRTEEVGLAAVLEAMLAPGRIDLHAAHWIYLHRPIGWTVLFGSSDINHGHPQRATTLPHRNIEGSYGLPMGSSGWSHAFFSIGQ